MSGRTGSDTLLLAVNTFVWHSPLTNDLLDATLHNVARLGYEAVELACENLDDWDGEHAGALLAELGLGSVVGAVFGPGRELVAASPDVVANTQGYVRGAIDLAVQQGSRLVIGPMYTSVGRTWRTTVHERQRLVSDLREALRPLAHYAAERGVALALEPLNRYETSLLNTTEQVAELIDPLPVEGIGINLDTYHMNIEEKDLGEAFDLAGRRLLHLQVCGNDRGAPGDDHQDWPAIRTALQRVGYEGMLGFESFTAENETIATAASIWRPFADTQDDLAARALANLTAWRSGWE